MTKRERIEKTANLYVEARKALKSIDKKKEPERYDKCLDIIAVSELILRRNGVTITL